MFRMDLYTVGYVSHSQTWIGTKAVPGILVVFTSVRISG